MGRGTRTSACSTTGFSSTQTTGSFSDRGFSYSASTSSMRRMYSSFNSAIHQLFFPPWLQLVALEQNTDRFPPYLWRQFPLHRLLCDQPHAPPRHSLGWRPAHHGDDALALLHIQRSLFARSRLFVQCRVKPFLLVTPANSSHRFRSHTHTDRHLRCVLPTVELTQDRSTPQHPRRFPPLGQHRGKLPPILLFQLDLHPMVALHVSTMRAFHSLKK